jgi:hypothetical protein
MTDSGKEASGEEAKAPYGNVTSVQKINILTVQSTKGIAVTIADWRHLKHLISKIHYSAGFFNGLGTLLLGVSGSAFVAIFTPSEYGDIDTSILILISIFSLSFGVACMLFGHSQRKASNAKPDEVITHMQLIEERYEQET